MNRLDLQDPQRQSLLGVAVIFFKNLRIALNIFISVVAVQFGFKGSVLGLSLLDFGYLIAGFFLIISYLQYRRFFFYVVDDKFIIEKGLFRRDRITIPFDRIQTVNLNQNLIQQLLNVMALKVDTAGSSRKALEIAALPKAYARQLQQFLIAKKQQLSIEPEAVENGPEPSSREAEFDISVKRPLIKLEIADLLKVGITENHLRTALIVFAVLNGYFWQFEEYVRKPYEELLESQAEVILRSWLIILPLALLLFLVLAVLISMIRTVLRYFGLEFFVDQKGVQLVSGLLKRVEYQIPVHKIQYLKWKSNPLRKLIGLQTLIVKQAGSGERADRHSLKVPGCYQEQIVTVLDEFFPEQYEGHFSHYRAHRLLFVQQAVWLALLPALLLVALSYFSWLWLLVAAVFLPLALFFRFRYWRSVSMQHNEAMLLLKKGWVYPSRLVLKFHKLQNLRFSQSIFQRRRGLASLTFYTAAGEERMPHLDAVEAKMLYNYLLYKIESTGESWM